MKSAVDCKVSFPTLKSVPHPQQPGAVKCLLGQRGPQLTLPPPASVLRFWAEKEGSHQSPEEEGRERKEGLLGFVLVLEGRLEFRPAGLPPSGEQNIVT